MADQLLPDPNTFGAITGIAGLAAIVAVAEEIVHEVAAMGGGQYQFQPDELQSVLTQWKDLQTTVEKALSSVHTRAPHSATVLAPGDENASDVVAAAAHTTNTAYQAYLTSMQTYIQGYVDDLSGALDRYLATEHGNAGMAAGARANLA